jgi:uncharacterized protein YqeY
MHASIERSHGFKPRRIDYRVRLRPGRESTYIQLTGIDRPRVSGGDRSSPAGPCGETLVKQKLQEDLKASMKSGDKLRTMTLRGVLAEITRIEKDVRREANETEIVQIIKRERSRRDETLGFARQGGRADLVAQNEEEARVLDSYLPAALDENELRAAIAEQVAAGVKQMGPLMKALKDRFGAQLDGRVASQLVKEALAPK